MTWQNPGPGRLPGKAKSSEWKNHLFPVEWHEVQEMEEIMKSAGRRTPAEIKSAYATIRNRAVKRKSLRA